MANQLRCMLLDYITCLQGVLVTNDGHIHEVPAEVRESYIRTGYRPVNSGFKKSLQSIWKSHNETLNIWTHLWGLLYFVYFFCDEDFWKLIERVPLSHALPMYVYFLGVCFLFMASSGAHLLNSVSMTWRNVCFMIDYSAISVYGSFTAIVYYYYNWNSRMTSTIKENGDFFIPFVLFTAIFATWISCKTRIHQSHLCHVIRTSSFALPFFVGSIPPIIRVCSHMYYYVIPSVIALESSFNISNTRAQVKSGHITIGLTETEYCYYYSKHLFYLAAAAIVNMIKVPECIYPGNFDIVGHSHQLFHVLIFMGVKEQFWLIINDISQYGSSHEWTTYPAGGLLKEPISIPYLAVLYIILISCLAGILVWYGYSVHLIQTKEDCKNMEKTK